ncbi:MAG: CbtA family protein [Acetobacteraceae bacterium]|jgi:predicted cobalt transporter CbtA
MVRTLLVRGLLIGLLAGLIVFGFALVFSEPLINRAIAFERHLHEMAGDAPEPEVVSRAVQSTVGLLVGVLVYSCALGGIFALVFAYAQGRLGRIGPRGTAALLAAGAFVVLFLVPQLKYPASPPSIGESDTIRERTALYFVMIAGSVMGAVGALLIARRSMGRFGVWNASLLGGAVYVVLVGAVMWVLPVIDEVPEGFPATLLWQFRVVSLGGHILLLGTLGLVFGALTERPVSWVMLLRRGGLRRIDTGA